MSTLLTAYIYIDAFLIGNHGGLLTETPRVSSTSESDTALPQLIRSPPNGEAITHIARDMVIDVNSHINSAIAVITSKSVGHENHVFIEC